MFSKYLKLILLSLVLTSCSTYPARFKCGDAKGLGCTMVREVDIKIDSGEIETAYKNKKKKCKNCPDDITDLLEPANDSNSQVKILKKKPEVLDYNIISF